ncbi:hypothetical protein [uncultured Enterovirga sp.]|uniref:hypothetical protein n=1 Tax=uncultured Enterovirga sp. TaxID=2026352 RepID=UPI0035C9F8E9
MRIAPFTVAAAALMSAALTSPALAREGGSGGDREPAGGAFMSSYPEQGSTGIQQGGPPRSADIPRSYEGQETAGSPRRVPGSRYPAR